jgi:NADH:ubiquinone oxidoreductase subunit 3 (subunit A)
MCVSFLLCSFLLFLTYLLSIKNILFDKKLAYECGFEPFTSGHLLLDISFAFVAILFLLFDLELVFLYP